MPTDLPPAPQELLRARVIVVVRDVPAKNMMWSAPQHVATVMDLVAVTQVGYY